MPFVWGGEGDLSRALRRGGSGCEVPFAFAAGAFPMFWGGRERLLPYNMRVNKHPQGRQV